MALFAFPPAWFTAAIDILEPHLHPLPGLPTRPSFLQYTANETEPNNTRLQAEQTNHLNQFTSFDNVTVSINGLVNGTTDPFDYFDFKAPTDGTFTVVEREGNGSNVTYKDALSLQAGESGFYEISAIGNADISYKADITFLPNTFFA